MSVLVEIALPCLALLAVGGGAPFLWARILPEGVGPLIVNGVLSALSCIAVATAMRFGLAEAPGWAAVLRWAGLTGLVWGPALILGVAQQPRRWKEVEW